MTGTLGRTGRSAGAPGARRQVSRGCSSRPFARVRLPYAAQLNRKAGPLRRTPPGHQLLEADRCTGASGSIDRQGRTSAFLDVRLLFIQKQISDGVMPHRRHLPPTSLGSTIGSGPVRSASSTPTARSWASSPCPRRSHIAREADLDLVEVAAEANPPVCRIMDYGKWKFEEAQRAKESRRKTLQQRQHQGDEVPAQDRPGRLRHQDPHRWSKFLGEGHKVKITIMFRGREVVHPELGKKILDDVADRVRRRRQGRGGAEARRSQHDHGAGPRQARAQQQAKPDSRLPKRQQPANGAVADTHRSGDPLERRRTRRTVTDTRSHQTRRSRRRHAEDEDRQGRSQALQGHRHRQDPAPRAGVPRPHPREEAEHAHASPRRHGRRSRRPTPSRSSACSAL